MATLSDLKNAITKLLNIPTATTLLQLNSNTCERAYEAYTFALCAEAIRRAGGNVDFKGINSGSSPSKIIFRGAPGSMSSRAQDFCYAACRLGEKEFEIHVDVIYEGQSAATHEIDVSVCDRRHAQSVRDTGRSPRTNKHLIMMFECKFYTDTPGVVLGRTFIGLRSDCTSNELDGFVANKSSSNLKKFFSKKSSPDPFFLTPLDNDSEELFIRNVEQKLRKWAKA